MTTTWHADEATLSAYAGGKIDDARAFSVEAHLLACDACRSAVATLADRTALDRMWAQVVEVVDAPSPGPVERALRAIGTPVHVARLLAATPSLRLSWLVGQALVLGQAVVVARVAAGDPREEVATFVFLMLAAIVPVLGVAVAYGPGVDPTYEIGVTAPMRGDRLLLIRATAVLAASIVIAGVATIALPHVGWETFAWLLPSFGLTLAMLALSTVVRPVPAAALVIGGWLVASATLQVTSGDRFAVFRAGAQVASVALIAVSAWALGRRRETFEEGAFR